MAAANIRIVDTPSTLRALLDCIKDASPLFLDLEGQNLGRNGNISILSIYAPPLQAAYLVDVLELGATAFTASNSVGTTLKAILESPRIGKVIFDVRNDSDALFSHFEIQLDGAEDLQLMELAANGPRGFVSSLATAIKRDSPLSEPQRGEWIRKKEKVTQKFKAGQYDLLNDRPIRQDVREYCAGDVALLPGLYKVYKRKMTGLWQEKVRSSTVDRIKLSRTAKYDSNAPGKARSPWMGSDNKSLDLDDLFDDLLSAEYDDEDPFAWADNHFNPEEDDDEDPFAWADDVFNTDEDDGNDDYGDTARDCIGWEEDMIRHGSPF